jgi:hypothetical protein
MSFTWQLAESLGLAHLLLVAAGCTLFFILIGMCCPNWDEPYPRVVQYAYPSTSENRWFLMHVAKTTLRKEWYVSSISQFVGARGTTGSKLMLLLTSTLSVSSVYIESVLWSSGRVHTAVLVLTVVSSVGLALLGFVESSIEWAPLPLDWPDLESQADTDRMNSYDQQLEITRLTQEEDEAIKAQFANLHMVSAFTFVGCQFAAQVVAFGLSTTRTVDVDHGWVSLGVSVVGMGVFVVFCLLQWLSGANDTLLETSGPLARFAISNLPRCHCCYWKQDGSLSPKSLRRISWVFIGVEIVAFAALASCPGWNGIFLGS